MKTKISKVKRNNQKRNKLIKQGIIKKKKLKQPNRPLTETVNVSKIVQSHESEESDTAEDMLEMMDEDDLSFLKNVVNSRHYRILSKISYTGSATQKKLHENKTLENNYEKLSNTTVEIKNLLPIKTKDGIIHRMIEGVNQVDTETVISKQDEITHKLLKQLQDEEKFDSEETAVHVDISKPVTSTNLLASRNRLLETNKMQIGNLSSSILENPEDKVNNISHLLKIIDFKNCEVCLTIKKLTVVSLLEIFKDLLPSYQIKHQQINTTKLKKETFRLQKYEALLLQYYKKYLQTLEKYTSCLIRNKIGNCFFNKEYQKVGEISIFAMCDLILAHPYFNYSQNVAGAIVPFLNHRNRVVREKVNQTCKSIFKEDRKGEITLQIIRLINRYLKNRANSVNTAMLDVLLALQIKQVNLEQEKENEIKQRKIKCHKQRVLNLSKKERKRRKNLEQLEKELLETKAEENKQVKQQNLTEITKIVFGIYFRILKCSNNKQVLSVCLEGVAKFAHCINMDFYTDLINVLNSLLMATWLGNRERLHCIKTIFSVLSGQGEVINLDPSRFYSTLYDDLLTLYHTKRENDFVTILEILNDALVRRRKKITNKRIMGFVKRVTTISTQQLHNGTLGCLNLIKTILQLNKSIDVLLDLDTFSGQGKYRPDIGDPEYCNAASSALFELTALNRHYHPTVCKYANHIAAGLPATGYHSLPAELGKCSALQLFADYNMDTMCFNPSIPNWKDQRRLRVKKHLNFTDIRFKQDCFSIVKNSPLCL